MKQFLLELISRLKSETPTFFKKVRNFAITMGGLGVLILAAPIANPNIYFPEWIQKPASFLVYGGIIAGFIAQLAKKDK